MPKPDLWTRLRQARIVQVVLVYLGVSWGVLQAVDVLQNTLSLPQWVGPVAVILLFIGLVIIGATAWVQSLPSTSAMEERGEVPSDWEIAPRDFGRSLLSGNLPHLTWGRTILGGVVSLSLLFGASGLFVILTGKRPALGPPEAGAAAAADGIAVVPFDVRGDGLEIWREGMMDLLTNNLDGVGGYRTIDARTVMARWRTAVGDQDAPDLQAALRAAGATGARYALLGSVVGLEQNVRLVANLYDLDTGTEVAQGAAEGPSSEVLNLADDLAVETMRALLQEVGREGAGDLTAENMTTRSLPALAAFLEGEQHYRKGEFAEAVQAFERAVASDTAFAIALIRLSEAYGWLEDESSEQMLEYGEKAMAYEDRLSPRYQFMLEAWNALNHLEPGGVEVLKEAVKKYPDDPETWFLLAETYIHVGDATYGTEEDIVRAIDRAVSLDPDFAPYYLHVADFHVIRGDSLGAREAIRRYETLTGHRRGLEHVEYGIPLFLGDSAQAAAAARALLEEDPRIPGLVEGTFTQRMDAWDRAYLLNDPIESTQGVNRAAFRLYGSANQGAMAQATRFVDSLNVSEASLGIFFGHANELWGWLPTGAQASLLSQELCTEPTFNAWCHVFMGSLFVREDRQAEAQTTRASLLAQAEEALTENPEADVEFLQAGAEFLEAYAALKEGRIVEAGVALRELSRRGDLVGGRARLAMGELEASEGHVDEAVRHYQASLNGWQRPRAVLELARLHERAGNREEALSWWQRLLVTTRSGDQDFPPRVEAEEAVARLQEG
jgi:tetratricopeptide (TPR) repeat protein